MAIFALESTPLGAPAGLPTHPANIARLEPRPGGITQMILAALQTANDPLGLNAGHVTQSTLSYKLFSVEAE